MPTGRISFSRLFDFAEFTGSKYFNVIIWLPTSAGILSLLYYDTLFTVIVTRTSTFPARLISGNKVANLIVSGPSE